MLNKLIHALLGLTLAVGIAAAAVQPAEANHRRAGAFAAGVATGVIGLGLLGAAAHARDRTYHGYGGCYEGPRRCEWRGRHCFENHYGEFVCRGGHYSCWRPTLCDD
jgi:hypothetical protein